MINQIIYQLEQNERILIATHIRPDGDAIGSLLALGLALKKLGKKVVLYNESTIPAVYRFLPNVTTVIRTIDMGLDFQLAIILDCSDLSRIGNAAPVVQRLPFIINIDHHISNTGYGNIQLVDMAACASAEIVYRLLKKIDTTINIPIATAIYTAIFTDTGSFRFANTNRAAFAICDEMVRIGVDPYYVAQHVYGTYSMGRIKLLNMALDSLEISKQGKLSVMALTQDMLNETGTCPEDAEGLIHYARRIEDIRMAVLIQEQKNGGNGKQNQSVPFHVSLRGDGTVDVAAIAAEFGGGGHFDAAGFNIKSTLIELKRMIFDLEPTL